MTSSSGESCKSSVFQLGCENLSVPMELHKQNRLRLCQRLHNRLTNQMSAEFAFVVLQGGSDTYIGDSDSADVFRQVSN